MRSVYDLEFDVSLGDISGSESESESDLISGGGAALSFGAFEVRAEYEVLNVEDGDVNMISLQRAVSVLIQALEIGVGLKPDLHGLQVRLSQTPTCASAAASAMCTR